VAEFEEMIDQLLSIRLSLRDGDCFPLTYMFDELESFYDKVLNYALETGQWTLMRHERDFAGLDCSVFTSFQPISFLISIPLVGDPDPFHVYGINFGENEHNETHNGKNWLFFFASMF